MQVSVKSGRVAQGVEQGAGFPPSLLLTSYYREKAFFLFILPLKKPSVYLMSVLHARKDGRITPPPTLVLLAYLRPP